MAWIPDFKSLCCKLVAGLLISSTPVIETTGQIPTSHTLAVSFGIQRSAERDAGFSPLVYAGTMPAISVHYYAQRQKTRDEVHLFASGGRLSNTFGAEMRFINAGIFTYKFYHKTHPERALQWGWSNQNTFSMRNFSAANNFSPRADMHTSFGPAAAYRRTLPGRFNRIDLSVVAHFQVIGFMIVSDYVNAFPSGFTDRNRSGIGALWHSANLMYPGKDWNWGIWPRATYRLSSGNSLSLSYRYDLLILRDAHRSSGSRGQYLFTLNMAL